MQSLRSNRRSNSASYLNRKQHRKCPIDYNDILSSKKGKAKELSEFYQKTVEEVKNELLKKTEKMKKHLDLAVQAKLEKIDYSYTTDLQYALEALILDQPIKTSKLNLKFPNQMTKRNFLSLLPSAISIAKSKWSKEDLKRCYNILNNVALLGFIDYGNSPMVELKQFAIIDLLTKDKFNEETISMLSLDDNNYKKLSDVNFDEQKFIEEIIGNENIIDFYVDTFTRINAEVKKEKIISMLKKIKKKIKGYLIDMPLNELVIYNGEVFINKSNEDENTIRKIMLKCVFLILSKINKNFYGENNDEQIRTIFDSENIEELLKKPVEEKKEELTIEIETCEKAKEESSVDDINNAMQVDEDANKENESHQVEEEKNIMEVEEKPLEKAKVALDEEKKDLEEENNKLGEVVNDTSEKENEVNNDIKVEKLKEEKSLVEDNKPEDTIKESNIIEEDKNKNDNCEETKEEKKENNDIKNQEENPTENDEIKESEEEPKQNAEPKENVEVKTIEEKKEEPIVEIEQKIDLEEPKEVPNETNEEEKKSTNETKEEENKKNEEPKDIILNFNTSNGISTHDSPELEYFS